MADTWLTSARRRLRLAGVDPAWESRRGFDESFQAVCAGLTGAIADLELPVVIVSSSTPEEGRTTVCAKLASTFAARGKRALVVDLDLRDPGLHQVVGVPGRPGASEVLRNRADLKDCMQYVTTGDAPSEGDGRVAGAKRGRGFWVLPAGGNVVDPADLLSSGRTAQMLGRLVAKADVVLVDTPPVVPLADTLTIASVAGAALLVVDPRRTNAALLQRARDVLQRNGTPVLGVVLNRVRSTDGGAAIGYPPPLPS